MSYHPDEGGYGEYLRDCGASEADIRDAVGVQPEKLKRRRDELAEYKAKMADKRRRDEVARYKANTANMTGLQLLGMAPGRPVPPRQTNKRARISPTDRLLGHLRRRERAALLPMRAGNHLQVALVREREVREHVADLEVQERHVRLE